ncbi:MAG: D-alanyl-D-alanine carboxypeptidase/D-alanyl-D-alanine-endopeptidase [Steroidobacteraceae bacterium]
MELRQRLLLILAFCGQAAIAASPPALTQLSRLAGDGARISAAVWDLDADQSVVQLGATERLIPASLSKITIAAAALETWAPDFSFATQLRGTAPPQNGTLSGNLILRGSGDATFDETTLWALAAQLRGAGIRRITGGVLVERAPFGELQCDTVDRCAGLRRSARAYNAAPSAIGVNYGSWCIAVRAPEATGNARVGGCATGELPIPLSGTVRVGPGGALQVERNTDAAGDRIAVSGSIAAGTEKQVHRAMSDPAAGAGIILRSILRQTGVAVDGAVETTALPVAQANQLLASVDGLPVQEQIVRMMRYSNNYIADVLTMGVALARSGRAPRSLADASQALVELVRSSGTGADAGPVIESGSGLTTTNRISALDLVNVLKREYRDPRRFPAFYGSFVVPGDASFAYLRSGNSDWQQRVALKTGSLTDPVSVNGIAGYLRKRNGGWMAFAVIVNGSGKLRQIPHEQALRAARSDIEAVLAQY